MGDWAVWLLGLVAVLAVGAIIIYLVARAKEPHRRVLVSEEQGRQWQHQRLLSSLGALDLAMTNLATAALQGREQLVREMEHELAQAVSAANRSGDDELCRLVDEVAARCDALGAVGQDGLENENGPGPGEESLDPLVRHLGEARRAIYRRMETLLCQVFD